MAVLPPILKTKRFLPLFLTQFLGAFNDNVFKNALVMLVTYKLAAKSGMNPQVLVTMAAGLFMLPYLLFSATAGQLADKYDRGVLARYIKIAEIILMIIASIGFYTSTIYFMLFVLFCMGAQATFFGPIKYALLPQHLYPEELIAGNAYIEAATFLAILLGTIFGGIIIMQQDGITLVSAAIITIALLGYLSSRYIPPAVPPMPHLKMNINIAQETWSMLENDRKNRKVFLCILGISWFWFIGATFLSQFPTYAKVVMHSDETVVTLFLTCFSLGTGLGSFLCTVLLKGEVKSTYVPWAAVGISVFTIDLFFASTSGTPVTQDALLSAREFIQDPTHCRILFDLMMVSVCSGLYIVPLYALMQRDSDPNYRARTIASNNVLNGVFMVGSAAATMLMLKMSFTVPQVFLTIALLNAGVAVSIFRLDKILNQEVDVPEKLAGVPE